MSEYIECVGVSRSKSSCSIPSKINCLTKAVRQAGVRSLLLASAFASSSVMATDYTSQVAVASGTTGSLFAGDTVHIASPRPYFSAAIAEGAGTVLFVNDAQMSNLGFHGYGVHARDGGWIWLDNGGLVTTTGDNGYGLVADLPNSQLTASGTHVQTQGNYAFGTYSKSGGRVAILDGLIKTTGQYAYGMMSEGVGSSSDTIFDTKIETHGQHGYGVYALDGGAVMLNTGNVFTYGDYGVGVFANKPDSQVIAGGTNIETDGVHGYGAYAMNGGYVWLCGNSITTAGNNGYGVWATGTDSRILVNSISTIMTHGTDSLGIYASNVGTIDIFDSSVSTYGLDAHGVGSYGSSEITLDHSSVTTHGIDAVGLFASGVHSRISVTGSDVTTVNEGGIGAYVTSHGDLELKNSHITTLDNDAHGAYIRGGSRIFMTDNSEITTFGGADGLILENSDGSIANAKITTMGYGNGVYLTDNSLLSLVNSEIDVTGNFGLASFQSSIFVSGGKVSVNDSGSTGLYIESGSASIEGYSVHALANDSYGVAIYDGTVTLQNSSVVTNGERSTVLSASGNSTVNANNTHLTAFEPSSPVAVIKDSWLNMDNSTLYAGRDGSNIYNDCDNNDGIVLENSVLSLTDTQLYAMRDSMVFNGTNTVDVTGGYVLAFGSVMKAIGSGTSHVNVAGANMLSLLLIDARSNASVDVNVTDSFLNGGIDALSNSSVDVNAIHSELVGGYYADSGSIINLNLANRTIWQGTAFNVNNVVIDTDSIWYATSGDSSDVAQLDLAGNVFLNVGDRTLTVHGDLNGQDGTISLFTTLNAGGTLADQITDRVLVEGNANGTTWLEVHADIGSTGASTDLNNDDVMDANEGISLAQVAGTSTAGAFSLVGGYTAIAGSPWRYTLHAYQPGDADENQRVVSGTGNNFWDYRLQSSYITESGEIVEPPAPPVVPTPPERPTLPERPTSPERPTPPVIPTPPVSGETDHPTPDADKPSKPSKPSRPQVVPQVPAYLSLDPALFAYGARMIGTLHERLGDLDRDTSDLGTLNNKANNEFYARAFGGNYRYKTNVSFVDYGYNFKQHDRGLQIGGTWLKVEDNQDTWRLGMFGSIGTSHITPQAVDGFSRLEVDAKSIGLTATYQNNNNGIYVDSVIARNYYDTDINTAERGKDTAKIKSRGWSYSLESGIPFAMKNGAIIEPQAQVIYQTLDTRHAFDADGLAVASNSDDLWIGRAGVRFSRTMKTETGKHWTPYMSLDYIGGHGGTSHDKVGNTEFRTGDFGDVFKLSTGITGEIMSNVTVHVDVAGQSPQGSTGQSGWAANAGVRWSF
ncbi:MAG: autotransporter outer membrane beta-barrel domain-containing protein [Enterobacteriaceae bacterium]|jgi:outer membrane autotransporter protein|nr:autotransporter outer membrane beta-barrel domain-containing protein [Enterobacteriaceae bacterium]